MNELACFSPPLRASYESGIVLQLADGTIQACNATALGILGLTLEELQSWNTIVPPWQAIHPDGAPFAAETHPAALTLQTGQPCRDVVMGLYQPNGELIWLRINTEPLLSTHSSPHGVITTFASIPRQPALQPTPAPPAQERGEPELVSEEAFFFQRSLDLLSVIGSDGYFKRINPMFTQTLGYSEAEFLARPFLDFVHPDDHPATLAEMEKLNTGVPTLHFENRYQTKEGSYRWLSWTASPRLEQEMIYCVARDVTQQKQWEVTLRIANEMLEQRVAERTAELEQINRSLQESESKFRTALDHIPDNFVIYDAQRRIQFVNTAGLNLTELPIETFLGRTDEEIFPPEVTAPYLPLLKQAVATKSYQMGECTITLPNRAPYTISVQYVPLLDAEGEIQQIFGITHDITRHKQSQETIRRSEQQIRRILDSLFSFVGVMTPDGVLIEANRTALEAAALSPADVLGKPFEETYWWSYSPDLQNQLRAAIARAAAGETVRYDAVVRIRDNQLITIDFTLVPILNESGQVEYLIPSGIDVSERKQAEMALRESQAKVQQQLAEIETIYQSAPIGLNFLDTDLRFVRINQRLAEMNGLTIADHLGKTIRELLPGLADTAEQLLQPILETGEPLLHVEIRGETPAQPGVQRVWLESFLPLFDGDRVIGINTVCEEITERKKIEESLRQFNLLIELSYEPIFVWDLEQGITQWNRGCEQLYGYTREAAIGQTSYRLLQTLHPLTEAEFIAILERDRQWAGELIHTTRAGQRVIVESRQQLIETNGRRLVLETNRDITERKQAEAALRQSAARLEFILDAAQFGTWEVDLRSQAYVAHPRSLKHDQIYGYDSLVPYWDYDTFISHIHPDDRPLVAAKFQQTITAYTDWNIECRMIRANGSLGWLWIKGSIYRDLTGQPAWLMGLVADITDRKRTEEALRENEDRLRMAITSAQLGIWDWNLVTDELKWDVACKAMFGLPPEAESNIQVFFEALHPEDRDRLQEVVQVALNPVSGGLYDTEYRTIGIYDKVERWLRAKGQAYYDINGKPLRFSGTVLNITEQKQAEAQREQLLHQEQLAREAAEHANRMKDEFLAILSHELRTPLNPILGWSKLLQSPRTDAEKLHQGLTTIERNARRQLELIDDLLDISRIIGGKLTLNLAPVSLLEPIQAALETIYLAAEAKGIQLEVLLDPTIAPIKGDAGRLQQVVWNLLSNALKFTSNGGRVEVRLEQIVGGEVEAWEAERPDHPATLPYAQITVTDTGKGIQPEFLPYVFESFRQQDSSTTRQFGGLGLGLAIARQVVEAHGGTITATSQGEGQGSTFTVQLPLLSGIALNRLEGTHAPGPDFKDLRVMLVDDEADSLELVRVLLEQEGASVEAVSSPSEALRMLAQSPFDLLISDIGMPDMDGYAFVRLVRTLPSQFNRNIQAIALSAYAGAPNRYRALAAGFQAHLAKPIEPQHLLAAIAEILRR